MSGKRQRLGRGLDALLESTLELAGGQVEERLQQVPVDLLKRGRFQPRRRIDEGGLAELAESIKVQGVVQPIVARPTPDGGYEIVAGERRWRAAQMAGLATIPVVVREVPDKAAVAIALIENIQREDLNPIEEATALKRLIEEFGMTHHEVAEAVGRSRAAVTNLLRLLSLNEDVQRLLEEGTLDMGHARALLALSGTEQSRAGRRVAEKGLSVRETERLVRRWLERPKPRGSARGAVDPDIRRLEERLAERLGAKVRIEHGRGGRGRLVIEYHSSEELEGILAHFRLDERG